MRTTFVLSLLASSVFAAPALPADSLLPVIAGNSISQDRLFINKYFKRLAEKLHYRMLDVTAWKVILNSKYGIKYDKQNRHRAIDDIRESIAEMAHYLKYVSPEPLKK